MSFPISDRDARAGAKRREFFDGVADQHAHPGPFKRYYNERLKRLIKFNVPARSTVLELGCGVGDLLAELEPARGVGIDFSEEMVRFARERHPELEFRLADAGELDVDEQFDYIVVSNLVGDLVDVQRVLERVPALCHERSRVLITHFNYLWGPAVKLAERFGIKPRQREQNWLELEDLENLLQLAGLEPIKSGLDHIGYIIY